MRIEVLFLLAAPRIVYSVSLLTGIESHYETFIRMEILYSSFRKNMPTYPEVGLVQNLLKAVSIALLVMKIMKFVVEIQMLRHLLESWNHLLVHPKTWMCNEFLYWSGHDLHLHML